MHNAHTVPEDIQTQINTYRDAKFSLISLADVENERIRQTAADALAQGKTVHHDFHRMLDVLFQTDLLVQIIQVAIDFHAGITGAAGGVQLLLLGALALTHHRG